MSAANDPKAFSARFREAMVRKGYGLLGATELAEALATEFSGGLSVQTAHKWVNGTAIPRPDRAIILARWLGVSAHWLRFGLDPENESYDVQPEGPVLSPRELAGRIQKLPAHQQRILLALLYEFEKSLA
jgi:transcriptional regulator with XRE-family HTH domain